ncbi:hypothetical protein GOP47_0017517 [Adiantum capillus-veneris]|uniref:NmrA-like domain-containing protein n=1 Tax=Adiantum capillus-veneris TaxID=13818 RepID=A0A9D4UGI6_ADICA|nr:hypothetical protein GOP47_0017517 [Adiantum capillus-veneris]
MASRVLIFGATGYIGRHIAKASLNAGHPTFLFVRPGMALSVEKVRLIMSFKHDGAILLKGSFEDYTSLVDAIKQVDVVISALGSDNILDQLKIIDAIKEVGSIKRFLPSEYGMDVDHPRLLECPSPGGDIFKDKREVRRAAKKAGIPYTFVSANCFAGYFLAGLANIGEFMPPSQEVNIYGDGNAKVVWVKEDDVAAYIIRSIEDPRAIDSTIYIRPPPNILSQNEVVSIWESLSGITLDKAYIEESKWLEDTNGVLDTNHKSAMQHFHLLFYLGVCCDFEVKDEFEASHLYPEVNYTSARSYLQAFL